MLQEEKVEWNSEELRNRRKGEQIGSNIEVEVSQRRWIERKLG